MARSAALALYCPPFSPGCLVSTARRRRDRLGGRAHAGLCRRRGIWPACHGLARRRGDQGHQSERPWPRVVAGVRRGQPPARVHLRGRRHDRGGQHHRGRLQRLSGRADGAGRRRAAAPGAIAGPADDGARGARRGDPASAAATGSIAARAPATSTPSASSTATTSSSIIFRCNTPRTSSSTSARSAARCSTSRSRTACSPGVSISPTIPRASTPRGP